MYVNAEAKLIYLAHPRTASIATVDALQTRGFKKTCFCPEETCQRRCGQHHARLHHVNKSEWCIFTTVRNHWDLAVSWFFYLNAKIPRFLDERDLREALDNGWIKRDRVFYLHGDDASVILRFENLNQDLNQLLSSYEIEPVSLKKANVSGARNGRSWRELITPSAFWYVHQRFQQEIERYGYGDTPEIV